MCEGGELRSNPGGQQNFCWRLVLHGTVGPARWRAQKQSSGITLARAEALEFQFFCSRAVEASLRPRFFSCGRNFVPLALWTADTSSARC